jgi:hypothetical protein
MNGSETNKVKMTSGKSEVRTQALAFIDFKSSSLHCFATEVW